MLFRSLKNYLCYHFPTRGRAGVKLGDADTSQTYLYFLILHACFLPIALYFPHVYFVFRAFSWTNLLTQCPEPVPVFCCFCILRKLYRIYVPNVLKIYGDLFLPRTKTESKGELEGRPTTTRRGLPLTHVVGSLGGLGHCLMSPLSP